MPGWQINVNVNVCVSQQQHLFPTEIASEALERWRSSLQRNPPYEPRRDRCFRLHRHSHRGRACARRRCGRHRRLVARMDFTQWTSPRKPVPKGSFLVMASLGYPPGQYDCSSANAVMHAREQESNVYAAVQRGLTRAAEYEAADSAAAAKMAASKSMLRRAISWIGLPIDLEARVDLKAHCALEEDGFALRPLLASDASVLRSLEALLETEHPEWLGKGKDVSKTYGPYDSLKLACAWKVDHPDNQSKYTAGVKRVQKEIDRLRKKGKDVDKVPGLPVRTARAAAEGFTTKAGANEAILLHGTSPERLLELLSTGFNVNYSGTGAGTFFGGGVYLAEDVGKTDQYVGADSAWDPSSELHKRLYGRTVRHPGDVFYVLVVRAALGYPVRTKKTGKDATSMDNGARIFPICFKELSPVPGVTPPTTIKHHSLIAELGKADRALPRVCSLPLRVRAHRLPHRLPPLQRRSEAEHDGQKLSTTDIPFMA